MVTNLRLSGAQTGTREESDLRFNYNNLNQIIVASTQIGGTQPISYSSDGGLTWSQSSLPAVTGDARQGDPCVDWTSDGTAWSLTIGIGLANLVVRCFKSIDGGANWTFDSVVSGTQTNTDRESLWIDHSQTSPYRDNMYAIWHNGSPCFVARRPGPAGTWQTPVQVSGAETTGTAVGADIKTNSNGDVFAFWPDTGSKTLLLAKSTDGGVSFGTAVTIASTVGSFQIGVPAQDQRRVAIYISGGAYRTATQNLVYACWNDLARVTGCDSAANEPGNDVTSTCKSRIWFARSTDGGTTWEAAKKINDGASLNDQFFSRMAVDETSGDLVIVYYDTIGDPGRLKTDIWMQSSKDAGVTWTPAAKITSQETDETVAGAFGAFQYGDYIGLTGYAGQFFACWTDRRGGGLEEIWGASIPLVQRAVTFLIERSTFGQDEIDVRRTQPRNAPGGLPVPDAFRVVVDGFTASELGISGPSSTLNVPSPIGSMTINCTGNTADSGNYGAVLQRFTFHYDIDFPDDSAFTFAGPTELVTLNVTAGGVPASAQIELIKQPDPFILHGDPAWLSVDLRLLVVRAGETRFGVTMGADASAAPPFIQQVMAALTSGNGTAGGETFDSLPIDESAKLFIQPTDNNGTNVFNFTLAKVHYIGLIGATNVRVFFRLFQAQTTSAAFDPSTTYRRAPSNPHGQPIALAGIQGNEYVTIPCFAEPRVDSTVVSTDQQTDDFQDLLHKSNVQTFTAIGGPEVDQYFGCWLDINQPFKVDGVTPNNVLPINTPPTNINGPFTDPSNPPLTIQQAIIRNPHQCLIAEIAFDPVAIPVGKDPSNWDKLAQRNIAWSDIGSAQALTTFEIRPTSTGLPADQTPDELMIDWGDIPNGSVATIYLPAVNVADILAMAAKMYTSHRLVRVDDHTVRCRTAGITYIPIPPSGGVNYAGLLYVDLPAKVRKDQVFDVVVRQVTNAFGKYVPPPPPPPGITAHERQRSKRDIIEWRRVLGAFQLTIPVKTKEQLLVTEERVLSVLRWIAETIPPHNRWYPVFRRYLEQIAGRVSAFGGDPTIIGPSPTGDWRKPKPKPPREREEERIAFTGKIAGLIFDRFGDFEGFLLDTEDGERKFFSREKEIEELSERAWRERLRLTVWAERHEPHRALSIIIREPPASFHG